MNIIDWLLSKKTFTKLELLLNILLVSLVSSYVGFAVYFSVVFFGFLIAFLVDSLCNWNYDCYCPLCNGCGEIQCDGVETFLEKHVRGNTSCTQEDTFIDQIEEFWDDYKKYGKFGNENENHM